MTSTPQTPRAAASPRTGEQTPAETPSRTGAANVRLPLRAGLEGLHPYGAPQLDVPVLLNVNENPHPPSEGVVASIARAVTRAAAGLNRYPDRDFAELRGQLAAYLQVESGVRVRPEQIWAANGSNEVMLHLLQAFGGPGRSALGFAPTYSMYPEYARDTLTTWLAPPRAPDFTIDADTIVEHLRRDRPAVLLLASPNNPTGTALDPAVLRAALDAAATSGPEVGGRPTATVVVVDEAYAEFRRAGVPSALELLAGHPHLAVSRTMSKAFGMAGLRLGYLAAAPELVAHLRVVRLPYHLSAVTQAAALAALKHREELMAQVASLRSERDDLVAWLRAQGLEVAQSDANFVLFGRFADRRALWEGLLERGVLIREVGPEGWLRVSVGTPEETRAFREALEGVLGRAHAPAVTEADHDIPTTDPRPGGSA